MNTDLAAGRYSGTILLAHISGYTAFLDDVRQEHADDSFTDERAQPIDAVAIPLGT